MKNIFRKIGISIFGLLQGTVGSCFAILGFAFAFPESSPGSKDYEEDMSFVSLGYALMFVWIVVMIIAFIKLHKDKRNLLFFSIPWLIGTSAYIIFSLNY